MKTVKLNLICNPDVVYITDDIWLKSLVVRVMYTYLYLIKRGKDPAFLNPMGIIEKYISS